MIPEGLGRGTALDRAIKIRLQQVSKVYPARPRPVWALDGIDLVAREGEFVSIVGPSGCGKTTLLQIVAGLEEASRGRVEVGCPPFQPRLGRVAYMFQDDLLMPWKTVVDNVGLSLQARGMGRSQARRRALEHLERFGLAGFAQAYPSALSGGMRQRVALLRTWLAAEEGGIVLLDEPLGRLDALTRMAMQGWLQQVWSRFRVTVLMVTHDIEEALFLSDGIYIMTPRPGRVMAKLAVPLPRPRTSAVRADPAFTRLKAEALNRLQEAGSLTLHGGRETP